MKKIMLFLIVSFAFVAAFSQDLSNKIPSKDLHLQNRDIKRQYRKRHHQLNNLPPWDSVVIYNLFEFYYEDTIKLTKDFVGSDAFLESLQGYEPWTFKKKFDLWIQLGMRYWPHRIFRSFALLIANDGRLAASYDRHDLRGFLPRCWEEAMAKYIVEHGIITVFTIRHDGFHHIVEPFSYLGVDKQGKIHVFWSPALVPLEICPLDDFPDEKWPELFCDPWKSDLKKLYCSQTSDQILEEE